MKVKELIKTLADFNPEAEVELNFLHNEEEKMERLSMFSFNSYGAVGDGGKRNDAAYVSFIVVPSEDYEKALGAQEAKIKSAIDALNETKHLRGEVVFDEMPVCKSPNNKN